ncbi:penicillin-binding protein 1A [Kordiimonas sp. SCSIO 12610]|uniref:penicillin-binding protein 1A n=1 Tax=Kordiimonas sp. SCSIO 12610 TaxID=2829597 RepID=UPI00210CB681|nr:penicillin-binding protein 1A [Kordiimonas sp. SCSIO 12610]UTW53846.1 penicillin-binding protein 1A [Kordiimonas sp. SCSIO 12610]
MSGTKQNTNTAHKKPLWRRLLKFAMVTSLVGFVSVGVLILWAIIHYGRDLPDYRQLESYEPAVVTRVHAGDGSLLKEYSTKPRIFVPINAVPDELIEAFLSAEDKNFYNHSGLDYLGMIRGNLRNIYNLASGRPLQGGSTITQQVAKNFLLTSDQKLDRKIKEMILTLRIERAFSKDHILELYLNEINFGNRSYGVAAAALNYFNKALNELTTAEMAFLAALPKAPNRYHPVRRKARAKGRRDWVLSRMFANGYIDEAEYNQALAEDLVVRPRSGHSEFKAEYFTEAVRRKVNSFYGNTVLYEGGLSVRTSLEPRLQAVAEKTLRDGLVSYDRRHGWRGRISKITIDDNWIDSLKSKKRSLGIPSWQLAAVHEVREEGALIGLMDGGFGFVPFEQVEWARKWRTGERLGPKVKDTAEVLALGDVIVVEALSNREPVTIDDFWDQSGNPITDVPVYSLQQIPAIEGALVAMDPHTGRVLAMVGGFDYNSSQYNRAVQAKRQPGSAFKPFVYAAALDKGFTPASLVLDAPFVINQGQGLGRWKPKNSSNKFYGPSTLRLGIEKSRNLMTVRLAQNIGMRSVFEYADRFGLADNMEPNLAASLGAAEVTVMDITAAYGMLVNGGKKITPSLIDRIQDRRGATIYKHDERECGDCTLNLSVGEELGYDVSRSFEEPRLPENRDQIIDPKTAFQLVTMMQGVVENGTGRKIKVLRKPLAGKTGTTDDSFDAWFVGFSADMVVGVFTGFDRPRSLGRFEEGSSVAVPIFRDFMQGALKDTPGIPFRMPSGIRLVRINAETGAPAKPGDKNVILEAFKPGTEPRPGQVAVLDGSLPVGKTTIRKGSGGVY